MKVGKEPMKSHHDNRQTVKVGDLVRVVAEHGACDGIAVRLDFTGWWEILTEEGETILWPEAKIEVLDEDR